MFRFRKYRLFVFAAAVLLFLLYRLSSNSEWEAHATTIYRGYTPPVELSDLKQPESPNGYGVSPAEPAQTEDPFADALKAANAQTSEQDPNDLATASLEASAENFENELAFAPEPEPERVHRVQPSGSFQDDSLPGVDIIAAKPEPTEMVLIHWEKTPELFPVPPGSLISLPTGTPVPIPRIQAEFEHESDSFRELRELRLAAVRDEMHHAWSGYRKYAWGHDELVPISRTSRDPFCGWAATLVDGLDTLWIMDMRDQFNEAYEMVKLMDFTTTPYRREIPVFETIIRYLGGLIAAYDVTGGKNGQYPALLDKAVELAEVLMSVFDTPNRMPILYYKWMPGFASQNKMADSASSIAELGSMTMEFTRLAQLTNENKYYDAVARIVDALEEWQNREGATAIPGIFPERVDASGCNRTAAKELEMKSASQAVQNQLNAEADLNTPPLGHIPEGVDSEQSSSPNGADLPLSLEFRVNPADSPGQPETGEFYVLHGNTVKKPKLPDSESESAPLEKRGIIKANPSAGETPVGLAVASTVPVAPAAVPTSSNPKLKNLAVKIEPHDVYPVNSKGESSNWKCIPQNLTASYGRGSYSMGGSQDSTYEYFPKQYLLLGGLVPKYKDMHEKVAEAVKKYLLYRPMIQDETRDILFSAKASGSGSDSDSNIRLAFTYEVTHLTCFLGGMFAMGGRIFNRPGDVEIGAKLTEGCVWAYDVMPSGIMPENARVLPCHGLGPCAYNESLWYEALDPNMKWRENEMLRYEERLQTWTEQKAEIEAMESLAASEQLLNEATSETVTSTETEVTPQGEVISEVEIKIPTADLGNIDSEGTWKSMKKRDVEEPKEEKNDDKQEVQETQETQETQEAQGTQGTQETQETKQETKQETSQETTLNTQENTREATQETKQENKQEDEEAKREEEAIKQKAKALQEGIDFNFQAGHLADVSADSHVGAGTVAIAETVDEIQQPLKLMKQLPPMPVAPQTHEEYVQGQITRSRLVPGFVGISDRRYILRPEAIESVWYMYRITGDSMWQEKGWRMFKAIIKATKTMEGHSAIHDVTETEFDVRSDSMESFWVAETLKYFYLLFSSPDVISLDDWVLNTEAHPFKRPT